MTRSIERDADGRPRYFIAFIQEISERRRLEHALIQAHTRLELAVRGSNITLLELNMPDGVLENSRVDFISAGDQLAGYDRSELPTDFATTMALLHPDDLERVVLALRAHLSGQTSECEAEYRVRWKDGSYRWRLARGMAVRDAEGRAIRCSLEALDALWRASASGRHFPLVVLDARMPGVDGPALAERILQSRELSSTRIILLTSDDLHGEVARFRELGIAACAMKPVQQEELLEIIYRVLSRPAPIEAATDATARPGGEDRPPRVPAESAASAARLRILLAEDNDFNQQLIDHLLRRRGHDVVVVRDGRKAVEALDHSSFDLMLLDIQMPELDGFQVIEALRRREQTAGGHLPVVALTAHAMKEDRERCLQAGMDDYLSKPIRSAELVAAIERVLAGRPASEPPPESSTEPGILVDPDTLLAACDDDPVLLDKLISIFQNRMPGLLARVQEAIARQDAAQLRESAHRLRGLLSAFSPQAAQAAALLEAMGAGGVLGDAASGFETLAELIERLRSLLENLPIDELRRHARRPQE